METGRKHNAGLLAGTSKNFFLVFSRALLVFLAAVFYTPFNAAAQTEPEEETPLRVLVELAADSVEKNTSFTITVLVDFPESSQVDVYTSGTNQLFRLIKKTVSSVYHSDEGEDSKQWTQVQLVFIPVVEGPVQIPSLGVRAAGKVSWTPEMPLIVAPQRFRTVPLVFRWQTPLPRLQINEWQEIALVINDNTGFNDDFLSKLWFAPPPFAIIEKVLPTPEEFARNIALKLRILLLSEEKLTLSAIRSSAEDKRGESLSVNIPALNLQVR
jgi:hypothetical protein